MSTEAIEALQRLARTLTVAKELQDAFAVALPDYTRGATFAFGLAIERIEDEIAYLKRKSETIAA